MKKIYIVANTKGGAGKTTISQQIMSAILKLSNEKSSIELIEIDNNNKSNELIKQSKVFEKVTSLKVDEADTEINKLIIDCITNSSNDNIVLDLGGGDDSIEAIKKLYELELDNVAEITFIVPILAQREQVINLVQMYKDKIFKNYKVVIALNQANNVLNVEKEFLFFFGNEDLGLDNVYEILECPDYFVIPKTNLIDLCNLREVTIYDLYNQIQNLSLVEILNVQKKKAEYTEADAKEQIRQLKEIQTMYLVAKQCRTYLEHFTDVKI